MTLLQKIILYRPIPGPMLSRVLAAILGGYLVAASACGFIAILLPLPTVDATLVATMLSFAVYASSAIRTFSLQSPVRAWLESLVLSASLYSATVMMT
ncbi:hypothetical protein FM038_017590 [Shewanella eurypsychrophilus]|uniref:DUF3649 domain-containing protein n=1 Tax=Shewanella eurypsychrophilus TaxID=2593656 RepID=A0ABX6V8L6_9GAMM|nr:MULTISPECIES: hypothetical protein [Shewanella]QFU23800.1 hypothetical protein FS418_19365 [Shewanella sp. YLB-09]QPG59023.1 hypothetical protein FM038_017590 [Shewanella eurypsychrophilus]